jgi:uncharacterized protein (DUF2147 family)
MRQLALIFTLLLFSSTLKAQDITHGTWYNDEKTGRIQFYEQGDKLFGKIVWLKDPNTADGKPRTDEKNPDKNLAAKPLNGLIFLKNFKKSGEGKWTGGTIYDPKSGKTYSCEMKLENPDKLSVRGFIGISLIGRTSEFIRATK